MPFASEAKARPSRDRSRLPGGRRRRDARSGKRVDGLPRAADRVLHEHALPRRRREHPRRASNGVGRRRRPHRRAPRRCRRRRRVRASAGGGTLRGRHARGGAGEDRDVERRRALHGAVGRVPPRRGECLRRRLAAAPLLRHRARELRAGARPRSASGLAGAAPRVLSGRADDRRGRAAPRVRLRPVPEQAATEHMLLELVESGGAVRAVVGAGALWSGALARAR